ncbi:succinylglutamate desuccinylase/aspartoacylase domain-containing protein [Roseobacter sp. CCS2]|uniref:succinylglutamate desuccinylase/aspartoacylase domain-containing protein n=1 Tax=Roseobacter sp. CCS2 TaxID=391593 RepID=UPI0000F3F0A8|nr:succinylglutamate desuccinylase/aspartoacylase family protein [Roseobacter sp. CCS2]EBA11183.1 Succinylglutamate desuccinylase/aspartoacylase [Roseobacter sp. CCS2]
MQKIDIPNTYPIEVAAPDISAYANGNTGIDYVWTFDSGQDGPHAMISAVVHGNEPAGAIALDWMLQKQVRPLQGKLTLAFMNIAAYEAFDANDPNASRWVEEDMNRVWDTDVLDGPRDSIELRRARAVRPVLEDVDYLFDIHTMQHLAPPLMMTGRHQKAMHLAAQIGIPERVVADFGHKAGRRMRDFGAFDDPTSQRAALLIECGQHWQVSAGHLARESALRFLATLGLIDLASFGVQSDAMPPQRYFSVSEAVTIATDDFRFSENFMGGEIIPHAGTLIGHDGDVPVHTPADDTMLVMPSKRLWRGQTAVRLAQSVTLDR